MLSLLERDSGGERPASMRAGASSLSSSHVDVMDVEQLGPTLAPLVITFFGVFLRCCTLQRSTRMFPKVNRAAAASFPKSSDIQLAVSRPFPFLANFYAGAMREQPDKGKHLTYGGKTCGLTELAEIIDR